MGFWLQCSSEERTLMFGNLCGVSQCPATYASCRVVPAQDECNICSAQRNCLNSVSSLSLLVCLYLPTHRCPTPAPYCTLVFMYLGMHEEVIYLQFFRLFLNTVIVKFPKIVEQKCMEMCQCMKSFFLNLFLCRRYKNDGRLFPMNTFL
jgi:hypothetical protein